MEGERAQIFSFIKQENVLRELANFTHENKFTGSDTQLVNTIVLLFYVVWKKLWKIPFDDFTIKTEQKAVITADDIKRGKITKNMIFIASIKQQLSFVLF